MGPTWGPHIGPMNLAIRVVFIWLSTEGIHVPDIVIFLGKAVFFPIEGLDNPECPCDFWFLFFFNPLPFGPDMIAAGLVR